MDVGLVYDPVFLRHDTGAHCENSQRLVAVTELLRESGLWGKLARVEPRAAGLDELSLVHSDNHINRVRNASSTGGRWLDGDTYASPDSYEVALQAVGGVLNAVDSIAAGRLKRVFALVRPPGHHANADQARGFCLFNNAAIAASYAIEKYELERILIADFDVHHGNVTEDIFEKDPRVLYFSTHQYPHYPGTGYFTDDGSGEGKGTTVNVPLPAFCGDEEYRRAYEKLLVPLARRFEPQLVIVSAGYDCHWADQLSAMQLTVGGISSIVAIIKDLADETCGGRMLLSLEGGYSLKALAHSIRASLEVLLGEPVGADTLGSPDSQMRPYDDVDSIFDLVMERHGLR